MDGSMKHISVLIVDESRISRRITSMFLRSIGVDYVEAKDGIEAVEMAKKKNLTVVFMNLYIPGINGFEATKKIRNGKNNPEIPIYAITTDDLIEMSSDMKQAGFSGVLVKPFDKDEMINLLQSLGQSNGSDLAVFDIKKYREAYSDVELQRDIVQTFLEEKKSDSSRIEKAFSSKDGDQIYSAIHYLKGSFSYLKASKILVITQSILDNLKKGNVSFALDHKNEFIREYKELIAELEKYEF